MLVRTIVPLLAAAFGKEAAQARVGDRSMRRTRTVATRWTRRLATTGLLAIPFPTFSLGTLGTTLPIRIVKVGAILSVSARTVFHPTEAMAFLGFTNRHGIPRGVPSALKFPAGNELSPRFHELSGNADKVRITPVKMANITPFVVCDVLANAGVVLQLVSENGFEEFFVLGAYKGQQNLIPFVQKSFEVVTYHFDLQQILQPQNRVVLRRNLVMLENPAQNLTTFHKGLSGGRFLLLQSDFPSKISYQNLGKCSGQFTV